MTVITHVCSRFGLVVSWENDELIASTSTAVSLQQSVVVYRFCLVFNSKDSMKIKLASLFIVSVDKILNRMFLSSD